MTRLEATEKLRDKYQNEPWYSGVGIGMMAIFLYVKKMPDDVILPANQDGYKVVVRVSNPQPRPAR